MPCPTTTPATWLVTGASRGLGLELVTQLLRRGDNVAGTTRSTERLTAALASVNTDRLLPLSVDLRDEQAVQAAVRHTTERFGGLDVVVNNAGYGFLGAVEETSDNELRAMFDVQLFGLWNVLRQVLPVFRAAQSGHVINISSILGLTAVPGWGAYCAGKFAVEGLSEALAAEVGEHGVQVSVVEPGYFRTDFLSTDSIALPAATAEGYQAVREMTRQHLAMTGTQLGDPVKGAEAIISLGVTGGDGRLRQLRGSDSYAYARAKLDVLQADIENGRELAFTTDHAQG